MTSEKNTSPATLATVKHGGCVQLPTSERARGFLAAQYRDDGDKAKAIRINHKSLSDSDRRALRAIEAALSAQHSPGDQGDALTDAARRVLSDVDSTDYHGEISEATYTALEVALAARQPVGESVGFCIMSVCPKCKGKGIPDCGGCHGIGTIESPSPTCSYQGQKHVARVNDEGFLVETGLPLASGTLLYTAAPPAQAVDLGQFREAVQEAYENADAGTLNKFSLEELLALIDSQAVGNGH